MTKKPRIKTVLIVDDDAEWRDLICQALGSEYPVRFATNGEDAMRIAIRTHPDAIILDIVMPGGKDGLMTFCELRKNQETSDIPVIILTEVNTFMEFNINSEELDRYLGDAPSGFLEKPINPDQLLKELRHVLEKESL